MEWYIGNNYKSIKNTINNRHEMKNFVAKNSKRQIDEFHFSVGFYS